MINYCFKQTCEHEAQYVCLCLSSETYCCKFHLESHLKLPNRAHAFHSILPKPCEWTNDEILGILTEEKSKKQKLKQIVLAFINQIICSTKKNFEESLSVINSDLKEIDILIEKVCQIPKQTKHLNTLILEPNTEKAKILIPKGSELYNDIKLFYKLNKLRYITSNILNRANNDPETEQFFRKTCKKYENYASTPYFSQAYQELIKAYEKFTSHYIYQQSNWIIYNTEKEKEENLKIPNLKRYICMTKLPNGELFCFGDYSYGYGWSIVDKNYRLRPLPSKVQPLREFLAIYFNRSVYCFQKSAYKIRRFDLDENRWIKLSKMQESTKLYNIIIFKGNFLISQSRANLLMYSIDIDSFSEIPYEFSDAWPKLLINAGDKLYLIEWGKEIIYESEDEYSWTKTASFSVKNRQFAAYYSYNNGGVYISTLNDSKRRYFKFDLNKKALTEAAYYYGDNIALRKVGDELKETKFRGQITRFDTEKCADYLNKGYTLNNLGKLLISIEFWKRKMLYYPKEDRSLYYTRIGRALKQIDNDKAINYFNKALELDPNNYKVYFQKGHTLHDLNRNLEALMCYNEAIKINPHDFRCICFRDSLLNDIVQGVEPFGDLLRVYEMKTARFDKLNSDDWDFIETLYKFQESALDFRKEVQNINEINKSSQECREQHSSLLRKAIFWLIEGSDISEIQLIRSEMIEHLRSRVTDLTLLECNPQEP